MIRNNRINHIITSATTRLSSSETAAPLPVLDDASEIAKQLKTPFIKVKFKTNSGATLVSDSDGRAGDGVRHWRAIMNGKTMVATLSDASGYATVTIAQDGRINSPGVRYERKEFKGLLAAVKFLITNF